MLFRIQIPVTFIRSRKYILLHMLILGDGCYIMWIEEISKDYIF